MPPPRTDTEEAQEWAAAQEAVRKSVSEDPDSWAALAACPIIEAYTDGSAPVHNPGGQAGFSAVLVGFYTQLPSPLSPQSSVLSPRDRPALAARLELGGYVPARKTEPQTSNNRAEIGGILLAMEAFVQLDRIGSVAREATIWSDSRYAIMCATGVWKRNKNTDLWAAHDALLVKVLAILPKKGFALQWVRGHAGNEYNEAADELATLAAFNFDAEAHRRFRAAQIATRREMPGDAALAAAGLAQGEGPPEAVSDAQEGWLKGADYAIALQLHFTAKDKRAGTGTATGKYRIWAKDGRSREAEVRHAGQRLPDEFEYMTLIAALAEMVTRLEAKAHDAKEVTLLIYSGRELMVKQLNGEYKVKSPTLQEPYRQALTLLRRFKRANIEWKRGREMDAVMADGPPV